ncbi:MAG: hypothetical protein P8L39_07520, partial [Halioglobus sp.]|nr:hypothetical protein [Halioglobus sp.]
MKFGTFVFVSIIALLSVSAYAETVVDVSNKIDALGLGIYAPLDGGNGKIEGSEKEGDKRGGNGAIVMSLEKCTTGEDNPCQRSRSAVAYDIGKLEKEDLEGLGTISYDYYT